jgi:DNA helicase-2/ATP-dependent DNA helicase PcrA
MEFKSVSENYEKQTGSVNLNDFLEEVSLVADAAEYSEDSDAVTLMTIHSAKGLEFKVVFIVGLEEGILPHANSIYEKEDVEEERRLMYVAITRAKERLYFLNSQKRMLYGKLTSNPPSRFIDEIRTDLIEEEKKEPIKINKTSLYNNIGDSQEFNKGELVIHETFGKGVVTDVDERFVTIAFSFKIGSKKFLKNYKGIKKV